MSGPSGNFSLLLDLARETSSEKRRDLLRQVTDVFLAEPAARSDKESALFDDIFQAVASDLETQVRVELANRIAESAAPLQRTARHLAMDRIEVARPVIEKSKALTERDILDVIHQKSQDHMMAVTKRPDINENVSHALVEKGSDSVVVSLLENRSARISRPTFETIADRAQSNPVLHAPFVRNAHVPLDILNTVYLKVEGDLRREIMRKFHGVSPSELEAALEASRNRLSSAYGALPDDYSTAVDYVKTLEKKGPLAPPVLVQLLRENKRSGFLIAFAKLTDVEFSLVQRLIEARDVDALAMLCRGAGFERSLFVTLCLMIAGDGYGIAKAEQFGQLYEQVPVAAAQRAIRFWKVRKSGQQAA